MNYNWTIFWNGRPYHSGQVSLDFIVWLVGRDKFILCIEGESFKVNVYADACWSVAFVEGAEPGSHDFSASRNNRADALKSLIEQLSESILSKVKVA